MEEYFYEPSNVSANTKRQLLKQKLWTSLPNSQPSVLIFLMKWGTIRARTGEWMRSVQVSALAERTLAERMGFEVSCHSFWIAPRADHRADGKGQFDMTLWLNYSITKTAYGVGMYCRISSNNFISHKFSDLLHLLLLHLQHTHPLHLNYFYLCVTRSSSPTKYKRHKSTLMFKEPQNLNCVSSARSFPKHQYLNRFTVFSVNCVRSLELSRDCSETSDARLV